MISEDQKKKMEGTHCLAARIICAFRSLKFASLFSGLSSHTLFAPAASGPTEIAEEEEEESTSSSRWYRAMRESGFLLEGC